MAVVVKYLFEAGCMIVTKCSWFRHKRETLPGIRSIIFYSESTEKKLLGTVSSFGSCTEQRCPL